MLTSEEVLRKIKENRDKIKRFGVKRIGLFGSYARGEQRIAGKIFKAKLDNYNYE